MTEAQILEQIKDIRAEVKKKTKLAKKNKNRELQIELEEVDNCLSKAAQGISMCRYLKFNRFQENEGSAEK